jgi:hypothetical protein
MDVENAFASVSRGDCIRTHALAAKKDELCTAEETAGFGEAPGKR